MKKKKNAYVSGRQGKIKYILLLMNCALHVFKNFLLKCKRNMALFSLLKSNENRSSLMSSKICFVFIPHLGRCAYTAMTCVAHGQ